MCKALMKELGLEDTVAELFPLMGSYIDGDTFRTKLGYKCVVVKMSDDSEHEMNMASTDIEVYIYGDDEAPFQTSLLWSRCKEDSGHDDAEWNFDGV